MYVNKTGDTFFKIENNIKVAVSIVKGAIFCYIFLSFLPCSNVVFRVVTLFM